MQSDARNVASRYRTNANTVSGIDPAAADARARLTPALNDYKTLFESSTLSRLDAYYRTHC